MFVVKFIIDDYEVWNSYFPSLSPLPYTKVTLSHQGRYLSSLFPNCIQKPVTFACLSWDVRLKKPRPILRYMSHIMITLSEIEPLHFCHYNFSFQFIC